MEDARFDRLAKSIASRRALLIGLAAVLPVARLREATAAPAMTLTPAKGKVGTTVTVTLTGFVANEEITLTWFDPDGSRTLGTYATNNRGAITTSFIVPAAVRGDHRVRASSENGDLLRQVFSVTTSFGIPGTWRHKLEPVSITVKGYLSRTDLRVRWYQTGNANSASDVVATGTTTRFGSATLTFDVPFNTREGRHRVELRGPNGVVLAAKTMTACSAGREPDGNGGCCGSFGSTTTGRAECCSKSWNPQTGLCVLLPEEENCQSNSANCANNYCIGRTCGIVAPIGYRCYGDPGCYSGVCSLASNTCECAPLGRRGAAPGDPGYSRYPCCSGYRRRDGSNPDYFGTCCAGNGQACANDGECCAGYCDEDQKCRCFGTGFLCDDVPGAICCNGPCGSNGLCP